MLNFAIKCYMEDECYETLNLALIKRYWWRGVKFWINMNLLNVATNFVWNSCCWYDSLATSTTVVSELMCY